MIEPGALANSPRSLTPRCGPSGSMRTGGFSLPSARATGIFHDRDRVRLQLILRGKRLGFTLDEIAHVINMYDETPGERGQLAFLIADIGKRREASWQSDETWMRRWKSLMILKNAAEPIWSACAILHDRQPLPAQGDNYSRASEAAASCWPVTSQRWWMTSCRKY